MNVGEPTVRAGAKATVAAENGYDDDHDHDHDDHDDDHDDDDDSGGEKQELTARDVSPRTT